MSDKEYTEGICLGHVGCPKHGSSDSLALYEKEINGKKVVDGYCWSECGKIDTNELVELGVIDDECNVLIEFATKSSGKVFVMTDEVMKRVNEVLDYETHGWKERRIPRIVSEFYGVKTKLNSDGEVTYRYYPSTEGGELVGWHVRNDLAKREKNETGKTTQQPFFPIGKVRSDCELFGQSKFSTGGKFNETLVIAAGEEDAMALFTCINTEEKQINGRKTRVLKKYITPVVSTTVGETALKQIKNNYEFVTAFKNVVIMYDNDKAGKEGSEKLARTLKVGQAKIAKLQRKDVCEHTKRGEFDAVVQAYYNAESYCPAGIVGSSNTLEALKERASYEKIELPLFAEELNNMFNGGIALGEITTIAAASSVGKTTITNEWLYHFIFNSSYRVGVISLESEIGELTENLMSLHINKKLANMDDDEKLALYDTPEFIEKHKEAMSLPDGSDRFIILDHQGAITDGKLMDKIEYLVHGLGCKIIILDPLTLAMSGKNNDGMDEFMSDLLRFVKREKVAHINVVHVRKNLAGTKANSTGATISEEDIKGSGSIFQVSMNNILLMRDKTNDDPIVRNTTYVVVSKNRRCGNTGPAGSWYYDNYTSRLKKGCDEVVFDVQSDIDDFQSLGAFNSNTSTVDDDWEVVVNQ